MIFNMTGVGAARNVRPAGNPPEKLTLQVSLPEVVQV